MFFCFLGGQQCILETNISNYWKCQNNESFFFHWKWKETCFASNFCKCSHRNFECCERTVNLPTRELHVLHVSVTWLDKLLVDLLTDVTLRGSDKKRGRGSNVTSDLFAARFFGMFVVPQFHTRMLATNGMAQPPLTTAQQNNKQRVRTQSSLTLPRHLSTERISPAGNKSVPNGVSQWSVSRKLFWGTFQGEFYDTAKWPLV